MEFSLALAASYTVENPEAGTVTADGRFSFNEETDLVVNVTYGTLERRHVISYQQVKAQTGN